MIGLISGVEELQQQPAREKLKSRQLISAVFSLILVGALLIASLFALNYSVPSTGSLASDQYSSTSESIFIAENETIGFNVTIQRMPLIGSYNIRTDTEPLTATEFNSTMGYIVTVAKGFDTPIKDITLNQREIQKLYLGLNITSEDSSFSAWTLVNGNNTSTATFTGLPNGNTTVVEIFTEVSPELPLFVHGLNGASSRWTPQWKNDGGTTEYFVPPNIDVTTPGKYVFELSYGNSSGINPSTPLNRPAWNGFLTLNWVWTFLERRYFYYGLAGLIFALGYIAFVAVGLLQKRKTKTPKLTILEIPFAPTLKVLK